MKHLCPKCLLPTVEDNCPDCGTSIPVGDDLLLSFPLRPDSAIPTPGPLSELYDKWRGKKVQIQFKDKDGWTHTTDKIGRVVGTDSRPYKYGGGPNVESGFLVIALDKPDSLGNLVAHCLPEFAKEL